MTLRWRKDPKPTGLSAIGAGLRGSSLYLDDEGDYLACISASGGNWQKSFQGWYWYAPSNDKKGIILFNSYPQLFETEKEAKDAAHKYIVEAMKKHESA